MTAEQRKQALVEVQKGIPSMTGITLTYHGERRKFNAYSIPLSILTYNPYNGRIGAEVKSYERQHHILNPDDPADVVMIEKFLWDSRPDANERTMKSLIEDHQQRFGIVTADGKIIDGNRRASLLNRIWRDETIAPKEKAHCEFFEAIILPVDADRKEIIRLETTYQMGEDAKVDYGPIEKYLKAGDLKEEKFSDEEIASFMGVTTKDVSLYLRVLKLMNEYLDAYGYTGIYTMLDGNEDSFLKLEAALRGYKAGGVAKMWGYDVDTDVSDLKSIAFDYIRLGLEQQEFRDIIRKPSKSLASASLFANEKIWHEFSEKHFETTEAVQEETVDEIIKKNPDADLKRVLRARDDKWRSAVKAAMSDNFTRMQDRLHNTQQSDEPLKLLQKALSALTSVDVAQDSFRKDEEVRVCLGKLLKVISDYKAIVES